jgi:hypothetical protein
MAEERPAPNVEDETPAAALVNSPNPQAVGNSVAILLTVLALDRHRRDPAMDVEHRRHVAVQAEHRHTAVPPKHPAPVTSW